jgi:hypothetical protein
MLRLRPITEVTASSLSDISHVDSVSDIHLREHYNNAGSKLFRTYR